MTSKIKVDDSNIIKKCGTTTTIGSGASNPIVVDGSAVTIGRCGGTVALASGASQTGFGRSGSVNWQTTPKTSTFTAANGEGYFVNTTSGVITMNLPAGSAGAIVAISDYARTFANNTFTISPNGSEKIGGIAETLDLKISGQASTFVYVDGTQGWINVQNAEDTETGEPPYITATGGTVSTCGDYKIHTFTAPGTFGVTKVACSAPDNVVDYLVVGGGGGGGQGGSRSGGGGGAGGFRFFANPSTNPQSGNPGSPLNAPAGITVTATNFPIVIGAGGGGGDGPGPNAQGSNGSVSSFSSITSAGGGFGGGESNATAGPGASGGGAGGGNCGPFCGASGNQPPTSPAQGTDGGDGAPGGPASPNGGGGGGGAIGSGQDKQPGKIANGGDGGGLTGFGSSNGQTISCKQYFAGGGGGVGQPYSGGAAPATGGDGGGGFITACGSGGTAGTANTGGGGAGSRTKGGTPTNFAGSGGSGVVIIRYRFK
jgi:hypothetical protein